MSEETAAPQIKRYIIQVNPGRPRLGIDLTLCPKSVLPDARNQRIEFTARIYAFKDGKWMYPGEKRKITFSFKDVSKELGICMNYPIKDRNNLSPASAIASNTNPDLFFPEDDDKMKDFDFDEDETDGDANKKCPTEILVANDNPAHSHHYKKATTKKAVTEAKVVVRCEDYGAFGILKAEADDCEALKPRERDAVCSQELGDNDVKIPRDENGNNIADSAKSWDNVSLDKYKDGSNAPAGDDKDSSPDNNNKGDGLTNYEEYRGFIVKVGANKRHRRTNINKKDVFIYDKDNLGTGNFNTSGLIIHLLQGPEYYNGNSKVKNVAGGLRGDHVPDPSDSQCININRTSHTGGDQHCLRIVDEAMDPNDLGYTYGANVPLLPKDVHYVAIHRAAHGTAPELSCTVAHELGHAVHVIHHGEGRDDTLDGGCPGCHHDEAGRLTSGNVTCVMRYNNYDSKWCHKVGGVCCNHAISNPDPPGNTFCTSANATGCNIVAGHFNNNASEGNCKGQIIVKDW